jgi:hypothetical protein
MREQQSITQLRYVIDILSITTIREAPALRHKPIHFGITSVYPGVAVVIGRFFCRSAYAAQIRIDSIYITAITKCINI